MSLVLLMVLFLDANFSPVILTHAKSSLYNLFPNIYRPHYSVNMTAVQVGLQFLNLTTDVFELGDRKGTILDSGTTLAYLPEIIYDPLVSQVCGIPICRCSVFSHIAHLDVFVPFLFSDCCSAA